MKVALDDVLVEQLVRAQLSAERARDAGDRAGRRRAEARVSRLVRRIDDETKRARGAQGARA